MSKRIPKIKKEEETPIKEESKEEVKEEEIKKVEKKKEKSWIGGHSLSKEPVG